MENPAGKTNWNSTLPQVSEAALAAEFWTQQQLSVAILDGALPSLAPGRGHVGSRLLRSVFNGEFADGRSGAKHRLADGVEIAAAPGIVERSGRDDRDGQRLHELRSCVRLVGTVTGIGSDLMVDDV